jgi:chromosome segregation ATPase
MTEQITIDGAAIEGLQKLARLLINADQVANALSQFNSIQSAVTAHEHRMQTAKDEYEMAVNQFAKIGERTEALKAEINADAQKERDDLIQQISTYNDNLIQVKNQIVIEETRLKALNTQNAKLEAQRKKMADLLNA